MDLLIGFLLVGFGILIGGPSGWYARGWFRREATAEDIANIKALAARANKMDPIPGSGKKGEESR